MKKILVILFFTSGVLHAQDTTRQEVYRIVEKMPEPEGGISSFHKYIAENIRYPDSARVKGISGKVFLKFIVDTTGKITDVTTLKGVPDCPECDEEAMRVVRSYPARWKPGTQGGKAVRVYYNLPISFKSQ